jgi:hypothetical protein
MNRPLPVWARFILPPVFLAGSYGSVAICVFFLIALFLGGAVQAIWIMAGLGLAAIVLVVSAGFVAFKGTVGWAWLGSLALLPVLGLWLTMGHQFR